MLPPLLLDRMVVLLSLATFPRLLLQLGLTTAVLVVAPTHDGAEVRRSIADVVAVDLRAEVFLRLLEHLEGVETQIVDEALLVAGDAVQVVDVLEQQPGAAFERSCLLACLLCNPREIAGLQVASLLGRGVGHACSVLIRTQKRIDDEVRQARRKGGVAQQWMAGRQVVGER